MAATMATMAVTTPVVAGLGGSSLRRRAVSPSKVQLTSGLKFSPCLSLLSCITICKGFISIIFCSARLTELSCVIYVYSVRERRQKLLFDDPKSAAGPPPLHVTRHLVCTSFSSSLRLHHIWILALNKRRKTTFASLEQMLPSEDEKSVIGATVCVDGNWVYVFFPLRFGWTASIEIGCGGISLLLDLASLAGLHPPAFLSSMATAWLVCFWQALDPSLLTFPPVLLSPQHSGNIVSQVLSLIEHHICFYYVTMCFECLADSQSVSSL